MVWAALGVSLSFASCGDPEGVGRQQWYNNASHVDGEAFTFFKTVYQKGAHELALAKHIKATYPGSEAAGLTDQIIGLYDAMLPQLEELGLKSQVVLPDAGEPSLNVSSSIADTVAGFQVANYKNHVAHEQYYILDQMKRGSRNTNKAVRQFAKDHLNQVKEVFIAAGGQDEEGAHH